MSAKLKVSAIAIGTLMSVSLVLQARQQPVAEDYVVVQQMQGATTVSLGGTVVPYKEVTLSAQLPGRVKFLAGIEGDLFKEGDLLVELDDSELTAKRQAALAQLANADAQLRNAGVQYSILDFARGLASLEQQVGDSGEGNELSIDASFIALGTGGRFGHPPQIPQRSSIHCSTQP